MATQPGLYAIAIGSAFDPEIKCRGWYARHKGAWEVVAKDGFRTWMQLDVAETIASDLREKHPTLIFAIARAAKTDASN